MLFKNCISTAEVIYSSNDTIMNGKKVKNFEDAVVA
jgi:hypothetical protein